MRVSDHRDDPPAAPIQSLLPTLAAACARILPSDKGSGAADAGVADYMVVALEEPFLRPLAPFFKQGCAELEQRARQRDATSFAACDEPVQDEILQSMEQDSEFFARFFFQWLVRLTLEGFLSDPQHGGNRDQLGWRFLGYHQAEPRSGFCLVSKQ